MHIHKEFFLSSFLRSDQGAVCLFTLDPGFHAPAQWMRPIRHGECSILVVCSEHHSHGCSATPKPPKLQEKRQTGGEMLPHCRLRSAYPAEGHALKISLILFS